MMTILADHWLQFLIVFGVAFGLSFVLTPLSIRWGKRIGIVAVPGGRRQHMGRVSKLGGLAMMVGFIIAVLVAQFLPVERTDDQEIIRLIGLVVGSLFIYAVGLWDDRYELSATALYTAQILAGAIAIVCLIIIESFNNPLTGDTETGWPYWVTVTVSLFWLGLMMNTVNFLDGLDGLAAGVTAIASMIIFIHATFQLNQVSVGLLPLALLGATLGFLPFNYHPAKIFMGSGAYFLGFTLGVLAIIGGAKMATILLVMGLPLMDLVWQAARRLSQGRNPMVGDRGHLHFRLIDMGYPVQRIVLGYYFFSICFGGIALLTTSRFYKLLAIIIMITLLVGTFAFINWRAKALGVSLYK